MEDILDDMLDPVGGELDRVTYVCFVMDHSGSMDEKIDKDQTKALLALSNFKEQLVTLRKESDVIETRISVIEFDDTPNCVVENAEIHELLNTGYHKFEGYWTGGMTALYDSIAEAIRLVKKQLASDKREDKAALIIIQTDGLENASKKYSGEEGRNKIKTEIETLENTKNWTFVFLGENIDKSIAGTMGVKLGNCMNYMKSVDGYTQAREATVDGIKAYYTSRKLNVSHVDDFYENIENFYKEEEEDDGN